MSMAQQGILKKIWKFLISLQLAVGVILGIAAAIAAGTIIESLYDTPTAQYWTYQSFWFHGILFLLGINIFCVAVSRWPWKKRHIPFLMAHAGILILLFGAWLTEQRGLDGMMRISEGETGSIVEFDNRGALVLTDGTDMKSIPVPWRPPMVDFTPMSLAKRGLPYDLTIDQYVTHAEPVFNFVPASSPAHKKDQITPAVKFKLTGGPMGISQEMWLWMGQPAWSRVQAGPAIFGIGMPIEPRKGTPTLSLIPAGSKIEYRAVSSDGRKVQGRFSVDKIAGQILDPGWKNVKITFQEWIPNAALSTYYKASRTQYGNAAPPAAIHLISGQGGGDSEVWLGMGERAMLQQNGKAIEVAYLPLRFFLPFSLRLERFTIDRYEGTANPSGFSSKVSVVDPKAGEPVTISMNEPLHHKGITFYQSSYEEGDPRPTTSIFSVNQDPGRPWKYLGSLLIVLGTIFLFAVKYIKARGKPV